MQLVAPPFPVRGRSLRDRRRQQQASRTEPQRATEGGGDLFALRRSAERTGRAGLRAGQDQNSAVSPTLGRSAMLFRLSTFPSAKSQRGRVGEAKL